MAEPQKFAQVLLESAPDLFLDYAIPSEMTQAIEKGVRVQVPLRGHPRDAMVVAVNTTSRFSKVQPIIKPLSEGPLVDAHLFELAEWMSRWYVCPLRQALKVILPASIRKNIQPKTQFFVSRSKTKEETIALCKKLRGKFNAQAEVLDVMLLVNKGLFLTELLEQTGGKRSSVDTLVKKGFLAIRPVQIDRSPFEDADYFLTKPKTLNEEQKMALEAIGQDLQQAHFATHLIHGITGSGKTEVYLQAIEKTLSCGKGAIYLVPEVALTTQTIERLRTRFREKIAICHHGLSDGERYDTWHNIKKGIFKIVVGARSAIFSPVPNLGLIVVDEEHESSYKQQEEAPCYHARDVAVMRGKMAGCTVILGSATPSLESYRNTQIGKYRLSTLSVRHQESRLAEVTLVDMRKEYEKHKRFTPFSDRLLEGIKKRHEAGEQAILFLNRRGYHTSLACQGCGEGIKCKNCDTLLTFHKDEGYLCCHLCGYRITPPKKCPSCGKEAALKFKGIGCELVEKGLNAIFPEIRTLRVDADTTRHKGSMQKLLRAFATGKADVLVGTQMIAKGLHFPEVTLVGVVNCDTSLQIPDFRASESTFQLITQVSGRSGRGVARGEVILQSAIPDNSTLLLAREQNYCKFYEEEIGVREIFGYPPFARLAKVTFSGEDEGKTRAWATRFRQEVIRHLSKECEIYPVTQAGHARMKNLWRFQFIIKGNASQALANCRLRPPKGVRQVIDIDPLSTFF